MLPYFQTSSKDLSLLQSTWKTQIDPILANPVNKSIILENLPLKIGSNVINHRLGRQPQGWIVIDVNGVAGIYRSAPFNDLTLTLTSNAAVVVTLEIF